MTTIKLNSIDWGNINVMEAELVSKLIINLQQIREKELKDLEISGFSGGKEKNIKVLTKQINRLIEIVSKYEEKEK